VLAVGFAKRAAAEPIIPGASGYVGVGHLYDAPPGGVETLMVERQDR
jgi:hypothetical protein